MERGPALLSSTQRRDRETRYGGTDAFWDYSAAVKRGRMTGRGDKRESKHAVGKAHRMRGPSNERKMPSNAARGGEYRVGGYTRAWPKT